MKTERRMNMGERNGLTSAAAMLAVVALFAFAAPQSAMAGTLTVPAPKETASIHLGVNDPAASALLKGWYCTDTDLKKVIRDLIKKVADEEDEENERLHKALESGNNKEIDSMASQDVPFLKMYADWQSKFLNNGWPFKLAGMHKSPTEKGLDAPKGRTRVYKFRYCYTKAELQTVRNKVSRWIHFDVTQDASDKAIDLSIEVEKWAGVE